MFSPFTSICEINNRRLASSTVIPESSQGTIKNISDQVEVIYMCFFPFFLNWKILQFIICTQVLVTVLQLKIIHQILTALQKSLINPNRQFTGRNEPTIHKEGSGFTNSIWSGVLHLDSSVNSKVSDVLVLAKRKNSLAWRHQGRSVLRSYVSG